MSAKEAAYRALDIITVSIKALEKYNTLETDAIAGNLKETFKHLDRVLEELDRQEVDL